jgi:hypothetical protein
MNDDDFIRQRLHELRDNDAAHAPTLQCVLRAGAPVPSIAWWRLAAAAAAVALAFALWPRREGPLLPEPSPAALADLAAAVEPVPSDALLAATDYDDPARLSREITEMLRR